MTTNVPQDVIDDLDAAAEFADDNVERYSDLDDDSKEKVGKFAIKFLQLRDQRQQGSEPVAWMFRVNHEHTVYSHIEPPSDAYDEGTLVALYTTPPQANALVAAALREVCMRVAAEVRLLSLSGPIERDELRSIVNSVLGEEGK